MTVKYATITPHNPLFIPNVIPNVVGFPEGGIVVAYGDFQPPMYKAPLEVMEVIKLIIEERTRTQVDYFRSPERGFFEMTQCFGFFI